MKKKFKARRTSMNWVSVLALAFCCMFNLAVFGVVNYSFETPAYTGSAWVKISGQPDKTDGVVGGWTFVLSSGIARNGSPWVNTAPEGMQTAYIQNTGTITQDVEIENAGFYVLTFKAANRPSYNADNLTVSFNGSQVGYVSYLEINNSAVFKEYSFNLGVFASGTYTLRFDGTPPLGDCATAIDDVHITMTSAVQYWNPDPLSSNWHDLVWSPVSGGVASQIWSSGNMAVFDQSSAYTVTVSADDTSEALHVQAGTVAMDGTAIIASDEIAVSAGATLSGAGARFLQIGTTELNLDGTLDLTSLDGAERKVNLLMGSGSLLLGGNLFIDGTTQFTGSISGSGGLIKVGAGQLNINNNFSGVMDVREGYFGVKNAVSGGAVVAAGAGLAFAQAADLVAALNNPASDFAPGSLAGLNHSAAVSNPHFSGADFGAAGFLKMGTGLLTLNSAAVLSTVTSAVVVTEGEVLYGVAGAVKSGTPIAVSNGGRLQINYTTPLNISHPLTISGNHAQSSGNGSLYIRSNNAIYNFNAPLTLAGDTRVKWFSTQSTTYFNQPIGGVGNVVLAGGGAHVAHTHDVYFNAPCTFAGDVTFKNDDGANAAFLWGVDNAMPINSVLKLSGSTWESNGTYCNVDLKGYHQQCAGIANGANISVNRTIKNSTETESTLEINVPAENLPNYTGKLEGKINLIKSGGGSQTLNGTGAAHSGSVLVQHGTLLIGANTIPNAEVTVSNGARLEPVTDNTTVASTKITGYGVLSRGAIYLAAGNDLWNGDITIDGTTRIGSYGGGTLTKTINGSIDGDGTLSLWAGGGHVTHENVYVLTQPCSFTGLLQLDASFGASLTVKLSGGNNLLVPGVPVRFYTNWQNVFCRLDTVGTTTQRVGGLISGGVPTQCRAVVNSTVSTTSTLTINTVGGTAHFEGVIGASAPCPSPGLINLVKEGSGAQIFARGSEFIWIDGTIGTNIVNANLVVNNGAVGFSGSDMLASGRTAVFNANGALLAPDAATLNTLRADSRITLDAASPVGLYDTWDISAADPSRMFYYSGSATLNSDNSAALPNGLILAGGLISIALDGAAGDSVFGSVSTPLALNGTSIKNNNNEPVLSAVRVITINAGGATFTAGWGKTLAVQSLLTGSGAVNINCDTGNVLLSNTANDYVGGTVIGTQLQGYAGVGSTLKLGASEVIPHGVGKGDLSFLNRATLDLNGFSETVNGFNSSSANALVINSTANHAVLAIGAADADGSFSGSIDGAVALQKIGSGSQNLSDTCVISDSVNVAVFEGALILAESCKVASNTVKVHRNGTLSLKGADNFGGSASQTRLFAGVDKSTQGDQAQIDILAGVNVTVLHFAIDGVFKTAGTWGATGSGADNIDDTIFVGGGTLTVLETGPASGTSMIVR